MVASNDRPNYVRVQNHGLCVDEPEHLSHSFNRGGRGEAPSAVGYLLTAAMGCQVNSLQQMLHESRLVEYDIDAECTEFTYIEDDVKRIQRIDLAIDLTVAPADESRGERCLEVYEEGCVVGETLKRGIDLRVEKILSTDEDAGAE